MDESIAQKKPGWKHLAFYSSCILTTITDIRSGMRNLKPRGKTCIGFNAENEAKLPSASHLFKALTY